MREERSEEVSANEHSCRTKDVVQPSGDSTASVNAPSAVVRSTGEVRESQLHPVLPEAMGISGVKRDDDLSFHSGSGGNNPSDRTEDMASDIGVTDQPKDETEKSVSYVECDVYSEVRNLSAVSVKCIGSKETVSKSEKQQRNRKKKEGSFQCDICKKFFSSRSAISAHVSRHMGDRPFRCRECPRQFVHVSELKLHARCHSNEKPFPCSLCNKAFHRQIDKVRHESTHSDERPHQCERCGKVFKQKYSLTLHQQTHSDNRPFSCKMCEKKFVLNCHLTYHMKSHKPEGVEKPKEEFECDLCKKVLGSKGNLIQHLNRHKDGVRRYKCEFCPKAFVKASELQIHVRSHTGEKPYRCNFCERSFPKNSERTKHERIHTGARPCKCETCGKCFRIGYLLTLHRRVHTNERPYVCDICGHKFKSNSVYKQHIVRHSDDRPYICPVCGKAMKTAAQLAGHKNIHTTPFVCPECTRRFPTRYDLNKHMEFHDGKRTNTLKHQCNICGAMYGREYMLKNHLQAHLEESGSVQVQTTQHNFETRPPQTQNFEMNILPSQWEQNEFVLGMPPVTHPP